MGLSDLEVLGTESVTHGTGCVILTEFSINNVLESYFQERPEPARQAVKRSGELRVRATPFHTFVESSVILCGAILTIYSLTWVQTNSTGLSSGGQIGKW